MRHTKLVVTLIAALALSVIPACGGGGTGHGGGDGNGFGVANDPLLIGSPAFPNNVLSGEHVEWAIPLTGGCGGPYQMSVVSGVLPDGLEIDFSEGEFYTDLNGNGTYEAGEPYQEGEGTWDNGQYDATYPRHHVVGIPVVEDSYNFTIRIDDTGCTPFSSQVISHTWTIGDGPLAIVGASPDLIEQPGYGFSSTGLPLPEWEDIAGLKSAVFGSTVNFNLIVAGGAAPYSCELIDDPADPDDSPTLPNGVSMPPGSCSILGTPFQVGPGGKPWRFTVKVTDQNGETAIRKIQWRVTTPAVILASSSISDGTAGVNYAASISVAEGVPPFLFELVNALPSPNDNLDASWIYGAGVAPQLPGAGAPTLTPTGPVDAANKIDASYYPAITDVGPDYSSSLAPSEGIAFSDVLTDAGSFAGKPRRVGDFEVLVHVYSVSVPNERGQHAFGPVTFSIAPAPALQMLPNTFEENAFTSNYADGFPTIAEFGVDGGVNNDRPLTAIGGVPYDGYTDAPHVSQLTLDPSEPTDDYLWTVNQWDALGEGWHVPANPGFLIGQPIDVEIQNFSTFTAANAGANLVKQGRQVVQLRVTDQQLPALTLGAPGQQAIIDQNAGISIGPDVVIITESNQSETADRVGASSTSNRFHNDRMYVKQWDLTKGSSGVKVLTDANLTSGTEFPAAAALSTTNNLGTLLSGVGGNGTSTDGSAIDIVRVVLNPTGWWDDMFALHPKGGRSMQNSDANQYASYFAPGMNYYGTNRSLTSVQLPAADGVTQSESTGVFADGGQLYCFENATYFGVYLIRKDGSIYVPFAYKKGTYRGFGDGIQQERTTSTTPTFGAARSVNLAISPNGRFAAMKLKRSPTLYTEAATSSAIVIFDLSGQKPFGGDHYKIIGTGGSSITYAGANVFAGTTMVMTNKRLYFIIQHQTNRTTSSSTRAHNHDSHWNNHHVMTYDIESTASAASLANGSDAAWTQTAATPMQTPGQLWEPLYRPVSYSSSHYYSNPEVRLHNGMNVTEDSLAPMPFRVNAEGTHCALMAAARSTTFTSTADPLSFYCWVDANGDGSFTRVSSARRKSPQGAQRMGCMHLGPINAYRHWGFYDGPSGSFEISDDGSKIAFAYQEFGNWGSSTNTNTGGVSGVRYSRDHFDTVRQNVILTKSTSGSSWTGFTENTVTEDTFSGPTTTNRNLWKFGGFAFSPKSDKLFFFACRATANDTDGSLDNGGFAYSSASTNWEDHRFYAQSYNGYYLGYSYDSWSTQKVGSYYVFDTSAAAGSERVTSAIGTVAGGHSGGTYTSTSPFRPTRPGGTYTTNWGNIHPKGAFFSEDRRFLYVHSARPILATGTAARTSGMLIGINLTDATVNGHPAEKGFIVGGWPSRRTFTPNFQGGYYYAYSYSYYDPGKANHTGRQLMVPRTADSGDNAGMVYFVSSVARSYYGSTFAGYYTTGHPVLGPYASYGGFASHVEAFSSNVGGAIQRVTSSVMRNPETNVSMTANMSVSSTDYRHIRALRASEDGSRLAYVFSVGSDSTIYHNREGVGHIMNLAFSPTTGALLSSFDRDRDSSHLHGSSSGLNGTLSAGIGRAGDSMAFDTLGARFYYAFTGGGNETGKELYSSRVSSDSSDTPTAVRDQTDASTDAGTSRFNVLYVTR